MSIKKLASSLPLSLILGAATACTFVCPPTPLATRICAQTIDNLSHQTLDSEFATASDFYAAQQWPQATAAFKSYIEKYGDTNDRQAQHVAAAKFFLGECYVQQNDFKSAYTCYKNFVRENPANIYTARATFRTGESAWRTGQHEEALRILEAFTQQYPDHALVEFALPYLGQMRIDRSEPRLAKTAFSIALQLFPNSSMAIENQMGLGNAYQALGNLQAATDHFNLVVGSAEEKHSALVGQAKLKLGTLAFRQQEYPRAVALLGDALESCSGETKIDCGYWLARAEMANGDHTAAVELVSALVTALPNSPLPESTGSILLFDGAVAATKIDRNELACLWLAKLQTLYPQNRLADRAFDLEIRLHQQAGRHQRVISMYQRAIAATPESPHVVAAGELAGRAMYARRDYVATVAVFEQLLKKTAPAEDAKIALELREQRATWLYLQSLGHLGLEQYDEALEELELADAYNHSKSMTALIALARGTSFFGLQQYSRAVEYYRSYLRSGSPGDDRMRASCELALCFAELKQWNDAQDTFGIMRELPAHEMITETTQHLAEKAYDAGEKNTAETFYLAMASAPNTQSVITRGLSGLAWVNMESTDSAKALRVFKRLIEDYPDSQFARNAVMSRATFLEDAGLDSDASEMYSLVIERYPSSDAARASRLRKVALLRKMGGPTNLGVAQDLLKEQLQQSDSSSDDETLYQLAWVLVDLGKNEEGMARFNRLLQQYPNSKYWSDAALRIATQQARQGDVEVASDMADAILKKNGAATKVSVRAMLLKCQLAAESNDWPEVTRLMKLIKRSDLENDSSVATVTSSKATYWLAESLYQQEMYNKSSQEFAAILDDTVLEAELQPWVRLRLAQCLGKLERWEDAANVAEDGLVQFSDFSHVHEFTFVKARGLETRGMLSDAQELYNRVIESESGGGSETSAIAQWRIGEINFHREDYSAAIEAFQKVDTNYSYAQWKKAAILQAGKCQEHLGNWKHAVKLYSQLIRKFPESTMALRAKERLVLIERQAQYPSLSDAQPKRR